MGSPSKPEFVLFISNCKFSMNFLNKLKSKEELIKKFNIVDINKIPVIPDEIDEVPCVYDGKQVYQGASSFKWLNEIALLLMSLFVCFLVGFVDFLSVLGLDSLSSSLVELFDSLCSFNEDNDLK